MATLHARKPEEQQQEQQQEQHQEQPTDHLDPCTVYFSLQCRQSSAVLRVAFDVVFVELGGTNSSRAQRGYAGKKFTMVLLVKSVF